MWTLPSPIPETKWLTMKDWKSSWVDKIYSHKKITRLEGDLHIIDASCYPSHNHSDYYYFRNKRYMGIKGYDFTLPDVRIIRQGIINSIHVAELADHPFLTELNKMPHVPRAVKSIYRKDVGLALLRATDYGTVRDMLDKAEAAWKAYLAHN